MKELKRRIEFFSLYDHTGIEKHLEKMAAKGWMLEEIGSHYWIYRRIEPQKLKFSVVYYPKKVDSDAVMSDDRQNFVDLCSSAGWEFVMSSDRMHIFSNDSENPVPIETDAEIQIECIHKFAKTEILYNYLFLTVFSLGFTACFIYSVSKNLIETLSDSLYFVWFYPFLAVFSLWNIISYLVWYKKAKVASETGVFYETKRLIRFEVLWCVPMLFVLEILLPIYMSLSLYQRLFGVIVIILAVVIILLFRLIRKGLYGTKMSLETKRTVIVVVGILLFAGTVAGLTGIYGIVPKRTEHVFETGNSYTKHSVIYHDENLPLDLEDLIPVNCVVSKEKFNERLLFVDIQTCNQHTVEEDETGLRYEITYINFPKLYEKCKEEILKVNEVLAERGWSIEKEDMDIWNANEVYRRFENGKPTDSYVVCWSDKIVDISFYWEATPEQIAFASEKLMNAEI